MGESKCLLCGSTKCEQQTMTGFQEFISCTQGYKFIVERDVLKLPIDIRKKISCLIFERFLIDYNERKYDRYYYSNLEDDKSDSINRNFNLYEMLKNFPNSLMEKTNRGLLNISKMYPNMSSIMGLNILDSKALFVIQDDYMNETISMFNTLVEFGFLTKNESTNTYKYTAKGKMKIEELESGFTKTHSVFVALAFREETKQIREAIKKAIHISGYSPVLIDETQHNNQIVVQILKEITNSKFVIVDVSFSNNGAYYEAGYAHGVGKEVIVCCKKSVFDGLEIEPKPHFDISQKNFVLWKDIDDLIEKLAMRINKSISNP